MTAVRLAMFSVAVAAAAWFALGARSVHEQDQVANLVNSHASLSAAQARRAESEIADARTLNPDKSLVALQAQLELNAGHPARARQIALELVREAPDDVDSWVTLAVLTRHSDLATNTLAIAKVHELAPPVARR